MSGKKFIIYCIIGLLVGIAAYYSTQIAYANRNQITNPTALVQNNPAGNTDLSNIPSFSIDEDSSSINHYEVLVDITNDPSEDSHAISLYQAWDKSWEYAKAWSADAEIVYLYSSDARDYDAEKMKKMDSIGGQTIDEFESKAKFRELSLGQDGHRRAWLAMFQSKNKGAEIHLEITDGVITYAAMDGVYQVRPILTNKPGIDSPEMIALFLAERPDFRMSTGKGRGYHFAYQISDAGTPELSIIGSSLVENKAVPAVGLIDLVTHEMQLLLISSD